MVAYNTFGIVVPVEVPEVAEHSSDMRISEWLFVRDRKHTSTGYSSGIQRFSFALASRPWWIPRLPKALELGLGSG